MSCAGNIVIVFLVQSIPVVGLDFEMLLIVFPYILIYSTRLSGKNNQSADQLNYKKII